MVIVRLLSVNALSPVACLQSHSEHLGEPPMQLVAEFLMLEGVQRAWQASPPINEPDVAFASTAPPCSQ